MRILDKLFKRRKGPKYGPEVMVLKVVTNVLCLKCLGKDSLRARIVYNTHCLVCELRKRMILPVRVAVLKIYHSCGGGHVYAEDSRCITGINRGMRAAGHCPNLLSCPIVKEFNRWHANQRYRINCLKTSVLEAVTSTSALSLNDVLELIRAKNEWAEDFEIEEALGELIYENKIERAGEKLALKKV